MASAKKYEFTHTPYQVDRMAEYLGNHFDLKKTWRQMEPVEKEAYRQAARFLLQQIDGWNELDNHEF